MKPRSIEDVEKEKAELKAVIGNKNEEIAALKEVIAHFEQCYDIEAKVLRLLIVAGFITEEKAEHARALANPLK